MASDFTLDGGMIPRSAARLIDERDEFRHAAISSTAVLELHGRKHVVRLVNISPSGAMVDLPPCAAHRRDVLTLQLLDRGPVSAQVTLGQGRPHRTVLRRAAGVSGRWR